jgi:PAS domain S-box-containing protein
MAAKLAAREAALDREARFRATFDNAAVGMAHVGPDGRWLEVNDRLCEITGYPRDELVRLDVRDIFTHPDEWAEDASELRRILAGEIALYKRQKRCVRKDGSLLWVAVTRSLVRLPDGHPDFFIATIEDIAKAKEAELALARSNRLLDAVIENLPAIVFLKRASDLRFVRMNRAGEQILGYPSGYFVGKSNHEVFPKDQADFMTTVERKVLATGEVREISETPCQTRGGTRYFRVSKSVLRDADGTPTHLLGVSLDITKRKQAEERLRLSEERYRMALEAGRLGSFDWDIAKDVVYWDERSLAALGFAPGTTLDYARSLRFAHPDDRLASPPPSPVRSIPKQRSRPCTNGVGCVRTARRGGRKRRAEPTSPGKGATVMPTAWSAPCATSPAASERNSRSRTRTACSMPSSRTCRRWWS